MVVFGTKKRVIVVGAGMGGMSAAIHLACRGVRVLLVERSSAIGGKLRTSKFGDSEIDVGPTVLTMKHVFEQLFETAGRRLGDYVTLEKCDILARHVWPNGVKLDLFNDLDRSRDAIGHAFGSREAEGFSLFQRDAARIFSHVEEPFLHSQKPSISGSMLQLASMGLGALRSIDAHRTMARSLQKYFRRPELQQLFGRYATYCGSSPFEAPATLNLVAHVESQGVWKVRGGMARLGEALERLARELGIEILTEADVVKLNVDRNQIRSVTIEGHGTVQSEQVVFDGDVSALASLVMDAAGTPRSPVRVTEPSERSLSAVTCAMVGEVSGFDFAHHNVFFSSDYSAEFTDIFERGRLPGEPTTYVCGSSPDEANRQKFFVIFNAPPTGDQPQLWTSREVDSCKEALSNRFERLGMSLRMEQSAWTTPRDFEQRFPHTGGALYGPRAKGALATFKRQGAKTKIKGLYLAGGSVHPAPGLPLACISGRLAAESLYRDHVPTPLQTVAIGGSTSMP